LNTQLDDFLTELKALLGKHDAEIMWGCDGYSDMDGIYGEYMEASVRRQGCRHLTYAARVEGRYINADDFPTPHEEN